MMRDNEMNQGQGEKLPSERIAERNAASNNWQRVQGADVDEDTQRDPEITAGREAMRNYPPDRSRQQDQSRDQSRNQTAGAGQQFSTGQDIPAAGNQPRPGRQNQGNPDYGNGQKENDVPGTVSLDTDPIDRPSKLS